MGGKRVERGEGRWSGVEWGGGGGGMKCSGVAVLVADLVTQLPELVNIAM